MSVFVPPNNTAWWQAFFRQIAPEAAEALAGVLLKAAARSRERLATKAVVDAEGGA